MFGLDVIVIGFHAVAALIAGLAGSLISRKLNESWAIPRDHWFPWAVSLGFFCALAFVDTYLSIPSQDWRTGGFDRLPVLTVAAAVLFGHAVSYLIVKARILRTELDREQ